MRRISKDQNEGKSNIFPNSTFTMYVVGCSWYNSPDLTNSVGHGTSDIGARYLSHLVGLESSLNSLFVSAF